MSWDESKHPRDEIGRFTNKGGCTEDEKQKEEDSKKEKERKNNQDIFSNMKPFKLGIEYNDIRTETPAEILLGNSTTAKNNTIQKERNKLIDKLGNKLTTAQVLYSNLDDLKKIAHETSDNIFQKTTELAIGKRHNSVFNGIIKLGVGKDTAGMLDLAHGNKMINKEYSKDAVELKNYNDPFIESDKDYLENKIEQQFKDYGFNKEDIKGYYFKNNSEPSQRISKNPDFKEILRKNKTSILNGNDFSGRFEKHGNLGIFNDNDLKNAIGGFDARHPQFDSEGNLHLRIYDTYDFNKNANDFLNKAGRHEMEAGNLEPYFSIHDIIIPREDIEEILK